MNDKDKAFAYDELKKTLFKKSENIVITCKYQENGLCRFFNRLRNKEFALSAIKEVAKSNLKQGRMISPIWLLNAVEEIEKI